MSSRVGSGNIFTIRELQPEQDLAGWLRLAQAVEMDKDGAAQTTEEQLRKTLSWPRTRRWVVADPQDPQTLIGYGLLFSQIPERSAADISVHPRWRRRGLGSQMLAHLLEQARLSGAKYAYNEIDENDLDEVDFLRERGFQMAGDVWLLRAPAEADFDLPSLPVGYTIRSFAEVGDLHTLVQACNRGFGDLWGHHENTAGGITEEEMGEWLPHWDPAGLFLAFGPDGAPAGFCRAESATHTGDTEDLVDEPGVAPEHRPLRLQRPLALTALQWLRGQGRRPVRLESWGDTPETVALYQEMGFILDKHWFSLAYTL